MEKRALGIPYVAEGSVVTLRDAETQEDEVHCMETTEEHRTGVRKVQTHPNSATYMGQDAPLYKAVVGRSVGDEILVEGGSLIVVKIQSREEWRHEKGAEGGE